MRLKRSLVAIVAVFLAGVVLPKSAAADEWNKRTFVTFSQDVELSGTVLPAGTCVFQLTDSQSDRHVEVGDHRLERLSVAGPETDFWPRHAAEDAVLIEGVGRRSTPSWPEAKGS